MTTHTLLAALLAAPAFALLALAQYGLTYLNQIDLGEGEGGIVSFTTDGGTLAVRGVTDIVRLFNS